MNSKMLFTSLLVAGGIVGCSLLENSSDSNEQAGLVLALAASPSSDLAITGEGSSSGSSSSTVACTTANGLTNSATGTLIWATTHEDFTAINDLVDWNTAKSRCEGKGWRLPTIYELNDADTNGLTFTDQDTFHWSSTLNSGVDYWSRRENANATPGPVGNTRYFATSGLLKVRCVCDP